MLSTRALLLDEMGAGPTFRRKEAAPLSPVLPQTSPASHDLPQASPVVPLSRESEIAAMDWGALEASIASCVACPLARNRTRTVPGVGSRNADWLFVGEAPGADEDLQGEPFVGQAGKLLDNMLAAIGLRRGEGVFITNTVKCRPPGNRNPEKEEMASCHPYLSRQIELLRPKLIVALGKIASTALLGHEEPVSKLRKKVHRFDGIPLVVTFHPAYLLRSLPEKARAWEDLCFAKKLMRDLG